MQKVELNKYKEKLIENLNVSIQMKTLKSSSEIMMSFRIHKVLNEWSSKAAKKSFRQDPMCINYAWLNIIPAMMDETLDFCFFIIFSSKCFEFTFRCIDDILNELLKHLLLSNQMQKIWVPMPFIRQVKRERERERERGRGWKANVLWWWLYECMIELRWML